MDNNFSNEKLTAEEAFWVMFYFLDKKYDLTKGQIELSDILSASQPFEFDEKGHFDGRVHGDRRVAPADSVMISDWNEAIRMYRENGRPNSNPLKK